VTAEAKVLFFLFLLLLSSSSLTFSSSSSPSSLSLASTAPIDTPSPRAWLALKKTTVSSDAGTAPPPRNDPHVEGGRVPEVERGPVETVEDQRGEESGKGLIIMSASMDFVSSLHVGWKEAAMLFLELKSVWVVK